MRRRFENIKTVAGVKIPVFACSISAPTTTWRNPVPILGCKYRSNGATMAASYVLDEINNSKVCTMGGNPISCTISNSGQYIQAYFNEGQVTGDIILQFTIGDVLNYFPYYFTFTILIESPILYSPWCPTNFMILLCLNIEILSSSA